MDGPADDDDDVDADIQGDLPLGSPLHPDDRLWRHPSELASAGLPSAAQPARRRFERIPTPAGRAASSRSAAAGRWLPFVLAGTVGALMSAGVLTVTGGFNGRVGQRASGSTSSTISLAVSSQPVPAGVADLAERLRPSLMTVTSVSSGGLVTRGTAVAVLTDHVLTAARVVVGAEELQVLVRGIGRRATVVGADADTDLALLAVEGGGLVPASWGDAAALRPGDPAIAVSTAPTAELGPTVTAGIISGVARTLPYGGTELRGLLQVDRPVPVEGAGGALLDPAGGLVGITLPATAGAMSFGYAVPAEVAKEVASQLRARGRVAHPWLGVEGGDHGMNGGAVLRRVKPASPAAAAGLVEGDVVTAFDGAPIPTMSMLLMQLRLHRPGDTVRLLVEREQRSLALYVTLADRPERREPQPSEAQ